MLLIAALNRSLFPLGISAVFLLALALDTALLLRRRKWLSIFGGALLLILALALFIYLILPGPEDCTMPLSCEWVGVGMMMMTMLTGLLVLVSMLYSWILGLILRRTFQPDAGAPRLPVSERSIFLSLLAGALLGLIAAIGISTLAQSIEWTAWVPLGNPIQVDARSRGYPAPGEVAPSPGPPTPLPAGYPGPLQTPLPEANPPAPERAIRFHYARPYFLAVETDRGRQFNADARDCIRPGSGTGGCWKEVQFAPVDAPHVEFQPCPAYIFGPPAPAGAVQVVRTRTCEIQSLEQASYAILADGTLWAWSAHRYLEDWPRLDLAALIGPPAGYLAGLAYALARAARRRRAAAAVL